MNPEPAAPNTYSIPADRLGKLEGLVQKLNKRADKLGMAHVGVTVVKRRWKFATGNDSNLPAELRSKIHIVDVDFTGAAPRIGGFTFEAKLDHQPSGNLVLRGPSSKLDLDGWRVASPRCQHCGLDRRRAETFLLSTDKGELLQIGRQCLVDYIGTTDVANAVAWYKCLEKIVDSCGEDGECGFGGGWYNPTSVLAFVAAAVSSVRIRGFHPAAAECPTKGHCRFITGRRPLPTQGSDAAGRDWDAAQPTPAQLETAAAIIAWAKASTDQSDFFHNVRIAVAGETLLDRTEGLLAALPGCYDKSLVKAREERRGPGPHVGEKGKYIECKVQVKFSSGFENERNGFVTSGTFLILTDENNSTLKTWSSSREIQNTEDFDGDWYLRATVKRHDVDAKRDNQPVTVVTRIVMSRTPFPNVLKQPKVTIKSKGHRLYGYLPDGTYGVVATELKSTRKTFVHFALGGTSNEKKAALAAVDPMQGIWLWAAPGSHEAQVRRLWAGGWYPKPEAQAEQAVGQ